MEEKREGNRDAQREEGRKERKQKVSKQTIGRKEGIIKIDKQLYPSPCRVGVLQKEAVQIGKGTFDIVRLRDYKVIQNSSSAHIKYIIDFINTFL